MNTISKRPVSAASTPWRLRRIESIEQLNRNRADSDESIKKSTVKMAFPSTIKMVVLAVLCLQNSIFTVLRRYSQGVLQEKYSSYEVLLLGEIIKAVFSIYMISTLPPTSLSSNNNNSNNRYDSSSLLSRILYLTLKSGKMFFLAGMYGGMNILSFIALRNIGAGVFTIFAQCKILTTAICSTVMLNREYSWTRWRSLIELMFGVLLFSQHIWNSGEASVTAVAKSFANDGSNAFLGTAAVLTEVTMSGFASIYFEKVIKVDSEQLNIWERNFQLSLGSAPIYVCFIAYNKGGDAGYFGGWSYVALLLSCLGASGGLLVALSIKHGDAILKTLATTGAIILSTALDHLFLKGPFYNTMLFAGGIVILAICNYTFDKTPEKIDISENGMESHRGSTGDLITIEDQDLETVPLVTGNARW